MNVEAEIQSIQTPGIKCKMAAKWFNFLDINSTSNGFFEGLRI